MANENAINQGPVVPPRLKKKRSGVKHARKAAEDLRSSVGAMAEEYRGRLEEYGTIRSIASAFSGRQQAIVRENPTKAVFTALAVGFVLGLIFRR